MVCFDEEGTEFTLVLTPYSLFIIEEKDKEVLHNFSYINIVDLEKELINDIEKDIDSWSDFITDVPSCFMKYKNVILKKYEHVKIDKNGGNGCESRKNH